MPNVCSAVAANWQVAREFRRTPYALGRKSRRRCLMDLSTATTTYIQTSPARAALDEISGAKGAEFPVPLWCHTHKHTVIRIYTHATSRERERWCFVAGKKQRVLKHTHTHVRIRWKMSCSFFFLLARESKSHFLFFFYFMQMAKDSTGYALSIREICISYLLASMEGVFLFCLFKVLCCLLMLLYMLLRHSWWRLKCCWDVYIYIL